jgi:hypothetical protein
MECILKSQTKNLTVIACFKFFINIGIFILEFTKY